MCDQSKPYADWLSGTENISFLHKTAYLATVFHFFIIWPMSDLKFIDSDLELINF